MTGPYPRVAHGDKGNDGSATDAPYLVNLHSTGLEEVEAILAGLGSTQFNVKAYGAIGDGLTDDGTAIAATIAAAPPGSGIYFPLGTYKVTTPVTVNKALTLTGEGTLTQTVTAQAAVIVTASDVTIHGLRVVGRQSTVNVEGETGIWLQGASAASPISRVNVTGCDLSRWGQYGIYATYVNDFTLTGNHIYDISYAGIMGLSVLRGVIDQNNVSDVIQGTGASNSYGIALSRAIGDSLVTEPRSADVRVTNNIVAGVPNWEGIDTHAAERITITGNTVIGCDRGIVVVDSANGSGVYTFAPKDTIITGNTIDSQVSDGSHNGGIIVTGAGASLGVVTEAATGIVISDNTIRGHGAQASDVSGAIIVYDTIGLVCTGNNIIEPSPIGINVYYDNYNYLLADNTVTDPWSTAVGQAIGVHVRSRYNTGTIAGITVARGAKSATHVATLGMRIEVNDATVVTHLGPCNFTDCGAQYDGDGRGTLRFLAAKVGFNNATPIVKPTVSGAKGSNAALGSLVTALADYGLITDSTSA